MKKELEFNKIVNDILKCNEFINLKYELHHGMTRLDHSLNVAHLSYDIARSLKSKKVKEITRAALLHDFFFDSEINKFSFINHPEYALKNAKKYFNLSSVEENIIISHMFPISKYVPKHKESVLVSLVDKLVAIKEMTKYKVPLTIGTTFIFLFNFMIINRYIH